MFFDPRTLSWIGNGRNVIDDVTICVTKPAEYGDMPIFDRPAWLLELPDDEERSYWESICYGTERIVCLNGIVNRGEKGDVGSVRCHHCRHPCNGGYAYWLCPRCSKDMCETCYEESEAETVAACRSHGVLFVSCSSRFQYVCDVCDCPIYEATWRHHENPPYDSIDLCGECEPTEAMRNLIFDDNFSDPDLSGNTRFDAAGFGSMLDWIPVGCDTKGDMALVCLNPASPNCGHVAIMHADCRQRRGYFDLGIDLATFIARTEEHITAADDFVALWMGIKRLAVHYF